MTKAVFDRFNGLFSASGWIATSALSAATVQAAINLAETGDFTAAEDYLTAQVTGELLEKHLRIWLMRLKALALRETLIRLALEDYKAGRYHACIPVILSQIDGLVSDLHEGQVFFTNAIDTGVWDALVAQDDSLITLHRLFTKPRKKTAIEPVSIPYRNGILHGRDLGYANQTVAAKTWIALFAVLDWALTVKTGEPVPSEQTTLPDHHWTPRQVTIGRNIPAQGAPTDYSPDTPERRLVEFLTYWQQGNFGYMANCLPPEDRVEPKVLPFRVKTHFGERVLVGYELLRVVEQGAGETVILVRLIFAGGELQEKTFEIVNTAGKWVITGWQWL